MISRRAAIGFAVALGVAWWSPARGAAQSSTDGAARPGGIRGEPIVRSKPITATNSNAPTMSPAQRALILDQPDRIQGGLIQLGFDKLSAFDYDVFEVYSETNSGRPLLKSTNTIPAQVKAYDGKRVTLTGFVLPLRTRHRVVTEFLLLRDLGTCCFGARAQINHFVRVKLKASEFVPDQQVPYKVSGLLRVGEAYVAGYLTGIYAMDAEKVEPFDEAPPSL